MPTTIYVKIGQLFFDPGNPRLPEDLEKTQELIYKHIVEEEQIDDVLDSMSSQGFIEGDPIVVRPRSDDEGGYYVVEGNRRLAALKWLTAGPAVGIDGPRCSQPDPKVLLSLSDIPVQTNWDEQRLAAYLGYKHVTATREWTPEAKARFVVRETGGDLSDANLTRYARSFGSNLPTLKRWLVAHKALEQARAANLIAQERLRDQLNFGTFYTLLGGEQVKSFLGLKSGEVTDNPVANEDAFREFLSWTVGTVSDAPSVNSRNQKELEAILANPDALEQFREMRDVRAALLYTGFRADQVALELRKARFIVERTFTVVYKVAFDPNVKRAVKELVGAVSELQRRSEAAD